MDAVRILVCLAMLFVIGCDKTLPDLVTEVVSSVVRVEITNDEGRQFRGSGVIVGDFVLTARHIIDDVNEVTIFFDNGTEYRATEWTYDPNNDVGLIDITTVKGLQIAVFDDIECKPGQQVFIIGTPYGMFNSFSAGHVAAINRYEEFFGEDDLLQLDIAGNPGHSGCPVFNMQGRIVGILVGGIRLESGVIFAIPSDTCMEFIDEQRNKTDLQKTRSEIP